MLANNLLRSSNISLGGGGGSHWIAALGSSRNRDARSVALDSSGNSYIIGYSEPPTGANYNADVLIAKYDALGTLQWQRSLKSSYEDYGYGIAVDNSGNVYITGIMRPTSTTSKLLIAKYDTSGILQWKRQLGISTEYGYGIAVDGSGNAYITGRTGSSAFTAKYDTSGVLQWQRTLIGSSNTLGYGIAVDGSGNVYIAGYIRPGGTAGTDALIAKYNNSGTIQWQSRLGKSGDEYYNGIAIDSSGNAYVTGYSSVSNYTAIIAKYDTSGVLQWQRSLTLTGYSLVGRGIAVDGSGNAYVIGTAQVGPDKVFIAKYDASGTIQWQRTFGGSDLDQGYGIAVDNSSNVYITGRTNSSIFPSAFLAKLPADGSKTGTYGAFTYAVSSLTAGTPSYTHSAGGGTDSASTFIDSDAGITDAAAGLTSTVISV